MARSPPTSTVPGYGVYVENEEPIDLFNNVCENGGLVMWYIIVFFAIAMGVFAYLYLSDDANLRRDRRENRCLSQTEYGKIWEEIFVAPFVPGTFETYIGLVFFFWFLMTVTFGITRYYELKWGNENSSEMGFFNYMAFFHNCKAINPLVVDYTKPTDAEPSGDKNLFQFFYPNATEPGKPMPFKESEFYFSHHWTFGMIWLTLGFIHVYKARTGWSDNSKIRHKVHGFFGWTIAIPALVCHLTMATSMAWRNIVNQAFVIQGQYAFMIGEVILFFGGGMYYALRAAGAQKIVDDENSTAAEKKEALYNAKRFRSKHMVRMTFMWLSSVAGSGSVRLAAWIMWVISKFFPMAVRVIIERGACQSHAITGFPVGCGAKGSDVLCVIPPQEMMADSVHCWKPVFINLAVMDLIIIWLEWVFLRLNIIEKLEDTFKDFDNADKRVTVFKYRSVSLFLVFFFVAILMPFFFPGLEIPDGILQVLLIVYAIIVKTSILAMYVNGAINEFQRDSVEDVARLSNARKTFRRVIYAIGYLYGVDMPPDRATALKYSDEYDAQDHEKED